MSEPITTWAKFLTAVASAYDRHLATRQEAYERNKDKQQERAIQAAEEGFEAMNDVFIFIYEHLPMNDAQKKIFNKLKSKVLQKKDRFNKYD